VDAATERARVVSVVAALAGRVTVSVDTTKAEVAEASLAAGAEVVNDVSGGLRDPALLEVVARAGAAVVLGHTRGTPRDMAARAEYGDAVVEVAHELQQRVRAALAAGVAPGRILVDPGLGFAKLPAHNLALLKHLDRLTALGHPIVVGASRKSFLGQLTGRPPEDRELQTAAAHTAAILAGASVVRVHDVRAQRRAVLVADAVRGAA
jgi:dihydropteroate synthase